MKENHFLNYLKETRCKHENYLKSKSAYDNYPEKIDDNILDGYENLAIIYEYFGNNSKSQKMYQHLTVFGYQMYTSRFATLSEQGKENQNLLTQHGKWQLKEAIAFNLAQIDPQKATQLFEWAAENCYLPQEYIAAAIKFKSYDDIAAGHLWRGYALLNLGKYEEAHDLLIQVIPYLNKYKKRGIEMWRIFEYALAKALVPLCEYKLDPTQENLQEAQKGIEDCIKSLREYKFKLEGYLYYFHLKEMFPEVYNAEIAEPPAKKSSKKKTIKKLDLPPGESDTEGSVIVFDIKGGYLDVFGTNNELEEYVEKVEEQGEYPMLVGLMELYAMEGQEEPEPIIEECERLLASLDADDFLKQKTRILLAAAQDAKSEGGTIMLYFDDEV
ncbi:MAG: hypothetical protein SCH39_10270 [Methanosarcinales archaeon]|nr:hypothetical protein [Methanosarcinales archaeon]